MTTNRFKPLLLVTVAVVLLAPSAHATQDNSAAVSGTGNVLATGPGAFSTTATATKANLWRERPVGRWQDWDNSVKH